MVMKAASGELCLDICFGRALSFQAPAMVLMHDPGGLQQAALFCCIHCGESTLKWMVKWSAVGCKKGPLCQKTLPKGMST